MKSGMTSRSLITAAVVAVAAVTYADTKDNPYQIIIDRNPFGLKPIPPPIVNTASTEPTNAPPPMEVKLTGIDTLLGYPRVLLQMQNTQTKKLEFPPGLQVNERQGDIEILAIDVQNQTVRIRQGEAETTLDFEKNGVKPQTAGATPGSPVPPPPGSPMMPLGIPAPPGASPASFSRGAGNVSVSGGQTPITTAAATPAPTFSGGIPPRPMRAENVNPNVLIGGSGQAAQAPTPTPTVHPAQNAEDVMRDIEARRRLIQEKEAQGLVPKGMGNILPPTRFNPQPGATPPAPAQ